MNTSLFDYLEKRVGRVHLRQRLGIEKENEARIFRKGTSFCHLENWCSVHSVIRTGLKLFGLYERGRRNTRTIRVRRNDVILKELPAAFDGCVILHISDLHVDMDRTITRAIVERIQGLDYDFSVLTGDFRARTFGPYEEAVGAMQQVRRYLKEPVYGILGNHDTIRMVPALEAMGIRMLLNEWTTIERGVATLYLAGIDDAHYYQLDNIQKAAHEIPHDASSILLSHTPETFRHAAHADFKLMLCGHTHGGQICLPGGIPITVDVKCPRQYAAGPWQYRNLIGYTSVGAGSSIVTVRLNCHPEVVLHRLHRA